MKEKICVGGKNAGDLPLFKGSAASKTSKYGSVLISPWLHLILLLHYISDSDIQIILFFFSQGNGSFGDFLNVICCYLFPV